MKKTLPQIIAALAMIGAAGCAIGAIAAPNEPAFPEFLGTFSELNMSEQSGDCGGYTVKLWSLPRTATGKDKQIIGTVATFDGNCAERPYPIYDGRLSASGALRFSVVDSEDGIHDRRLVFSGVLKDGHIKGGMRPEGIDERTRKLVQSSIQLIDLPRTN